MEQAHSVLGTAVDSFDARVEERSGWFRRPRYVPRVFTCLEWTVDGRPLRHLVAWSNGGVAGEITPVANEDALREHEADYLRLLLGEPCRHEWNVMPDGRVPLLICFIGYDLECRALTAEVVWALDTVEWRDIAWQVSDEPLDLTAQEQPVITLVFGREQYDGVVRSLLEQVGPD